MAITASSHLRWYHLTTSVPESQDLQAQKMGKSKILHIKIKIAQEGCVQNTQKQEALFDTLDQKNKKSAHPKKLC